ncbi:MAG: imidazoleglycerol-phosphate dehydratase HisB [Thermoplasmata archaeon]|nr:MAG: imidazoleglycerol-phosphate dehydratase HisB [Thermoplasmata archaeon]
MRVGKIERRTRETEIEVWLDLDGTGKSQISTTIPFFDHVLESLAKHGNFDLKIRASGDNQHHIVEDVAICLGRAFKEALGDKRGIARFGFSIIPMDDVLILTSVDICGRSYLNYDIKFRWKKVEGLKTELIEHFLHTFSSEFKINLHCKLLDGKNEHHKAEALFKSLGLSLSQACRLKNIKKIPSTKGVLE